MRAILNLRDAAIAFHESEDWGECDVEIEGLQDLKLKLKNLLFCYCIVCYSEDLFQLRWVDLFILPCNVKCGDS